MKIVVASIITFTLAAVILVGVAGIENVLAQQPRKSTFDEAILNISKAKPAPEKTTQKEPVPEGMIKFLKGL